MTCRPQQVARPGSVGELLDLMRAAGAAGHTVRPVGSGHSFTPLAVTDGIQVSLDRLQGVLGVELSAGSPGGGADDPERPGPRSVGVARVLAGTKLGRLGRELADRGLAQCNLGDIDRQAIAGALATGTHGTGATLGVLATQVRELTLVTPTGEVLTADANRHAAVFEAARVSLGALGVLTEVALEVSEAYRLAYAIERVRLDDVLADLGTRVAGNRHFEFFWFPYSDYVMAKRQNPTDAAVDDRGPVQVAYEYLFENAALGSVSRLARLVPPLAPAIGRFAGRSLRDVQGVESSADVFATPRLVRFQEMEYAVPADAAATVVAALRDLVLAERFRVHFPVEVRFAAADDIPLSPAYGRDTCFIAVHMYKGMAYRDYFLACEELFRAYDGRPHWGKMHSLTAATLRRLYPRFDDFAAVRADLDPAGVMLTPYLRRLLGVDPART